MRRARRIAVLLVAGCTLLSCGSAFAAGDRPGTQKKSPTGAVLRSMVVPGWGQVYTRNYWKAGAFAAVQGSLIAGVWWNENQVKDYIRAHDFVFEKFHRNQRNRLIWWLAGITLLSMGDAYVDAQMYGLDWSPNISIQDGDVTTGLALAVRF
jgi:hypothetical protein